jgi:type I restriction enzyme, S subunit
VTATGGGGESELTAGLRRFKPYLQYRDSGVQWAGAIPAHWDLRRLKTLASVELSNVDKKAVEGEKHVRLCNYVDVYYNHHITNELEFMAATATADQIKRVSLRVGDVLITKDSESWTDIAVPAVVTEELHGVLCGYHLALIRPDASKLDGRFLARAFEAVGPKDQFQISANGITRFGLSGDAIGAGVFAAPPVEEQRLIADFLDRETAKIDALVAKKERLIELLQEKRTALITRAVTKGLDPTVPMKDSGVEWLGHIPAHWTVTKAGFFFSVTSGATPSKDEIGYWDGNIPWVTPKDMKRQFVDSSEDNVSERALREVGLRLVPPPAILIVVRGMILAHTFPVAVTTAAVTINQDMKALRIGDNQDPRFIALWLHGVGKAILVDVVEEAAHGTKAIRMDRWRLFPVTVPPLSEQREIAELVEREIAKIDALIDKMGEGIEALVEYRTALISAAVTGKIDVRAEREPAPAGLG